MAGRPREFDRDEALLQARNAFWERGYEGTSMSDLVDALGLASARIYAAFGSKEALFREAVAHYETAEGGFADRALAEEPTALAAIERVFREAIALYTSVQSTSVQSTSVKGKHAEGAPKPAPRGCMVVSAAVNCAGANDGVRDWLAQRRRVRSASFVTRLKRAVRDGELGPHTNVQALGDYCAAFLHGLSVQARDGVSRKRLLALVPLAMAVLSG